tara:strand:+ start:2985 stop:4091 length:1107 start_codon:yes stop_codon:yes gene_type:complete
MYDVLIVGAGFFGSVFAHEITKAGLSCLVIDKRHHIGGNCYTSNNKGINVHEYGPHIFHTNSEKIWNYVNMFAEFRQFTYSPVAKFRGEQYSLPFNMWTFNQLWGVTTPDEALKKIEETRVPIDNPANLEEWVVSQLGTDVYEKLVKGYTQKQWRKDPKELPSFIIKRLPFRLTYDANYYNDKYCGIPVGGYTQIFEKLLGNADVQLGVDFLQDRKGWTSKAKHVVYTGPLDAYFDYKYGELEYRTLDFVHTEIQKENVQGVPVINYTAPEVSWTRSIEHKHFEKVKTSHTVVTSETPAEWSKDRVPYYPINDSHNNSLAGEYNKDVKKLSNVTFGGRLAKYQYYDMDQVIASALTSSKKFLSNRSKI